MVRITDSLWWGDNISDIADAAKVFSRCPLWTIEHWSNEPGYGNELCTFILYLLHS